jgi:hypothetical protein
LFDLFLWIDTRIVDSIGGRVVIKFYLPLMDLFDGVLDMISLLMSEDFLHDLLMKLTDGAQRKLISLDYADNDVSDSSSQSVEVRYLEMYMGEWVEHRMFIPFVTV